MSEPSLRVREELLRILDRDDSRVGQVHRLTRNGMTPPEIAAELGVTTSGFVSNARTCGRAVLEGHIPSGPSAARQVLSFVNRLAKDPSLSREARDYLATRVDALKQAARMPQTKAAPAASPRAVRGDQASLRVEVEAEIRGRTRHLVSRIEAETGLRATDYRAVLVSTQPLDALARLVRFRGDGGTFGELIELGRPDLTLDNAVVSWAADLPFTADLVEEAAARVEWFS